MKDKKELNIIFINPNTEEQIVQAIAGVLAYNLSENDNKIIFDYKNPNHYHNQRLRVGTPEPCYYHNNSNAYQNSHEEMEDEESEM